MKKKSIASVFLIGALLLASGCAKTPKLENGQELFASIDGYKISADDLYKELKDLGGLSVSLDLIDSFIANKEITDRTSAELKVEQEIEMYIEYLGEEEFQKQVTESFGSLENFKKQSINSILKEEVALNYYKKQVKEDEIKSYYESDIYPDQTVKYILITPAELDEDASDEDKLTAKADALKEAKEIIKKINNGEKFEDLVKEYSKDKLSAANDGLLKGFNKDTVDESFFNATIALKDGEMTKEPVEDSNGYNIILKVSSAKKPELKDVKEDIVDTLAKKAYDNDGEKAFNKAWAQIRKNYNLNIVDTDIKTLYEANYE